MPRSNEFPFYPITGDTYQAANAGTLFALVDVQLRCIPEASEVGDTYAAALLAGDAFPAGGVEDETCWDERSLGALYRGRTSVTRSGQECLPWGDVPGGLNPQLFSNRCSPSAVRYMHLRCEGPASGACPDGAGASSLFAGSSAPLTPVLMMDVPHIFRCMTDRRDLQWPRWRRLPQPTVHADGAVVLCCRAAVRRPLRRALLLSGTGCAGHAMRVCQLYRARGLHRQHRRRCAAAPRRVLGPALCLLPSSAPSAHGQSRGARDRRYGDGVGRRAGLREQRCRRQRGDGAADARASGRAARAGWPRGLAVHGQRRESRRCRTRWLASTCRGCDSGDSASAAGSGGACTGGGGTHATVSLGSMASPRLDGGHGMGARSA